VEISTSLFWRVLCIYFFDLGAGACSIGLFYFIFRGKGG
jgi:hypothetical protein